MRIDVECYAGYRGAEEPRRFALGARWLDVVEIRDRWAGPDHRYFRVLAGDGDLYVLRHDEQTGQWTLGAYRRGAGDPG